MEDFKLAKPQESVISIDLKDKAMGLYFIYIKLEEGIFVKKILLE